MFCSHCGSQAKDTAAFCSKCGGSIAVRTVAARPATTNFRRASTVLGFILIGAVAWISFKTLASRTPLDAKTEPSARVAPAASKPATPSIFPSHAEDLPNFRIELIDHPGTAPQRVPYIEKGFPPWGRQGELDEHLEFRDVPGSPGYQEVKITFIDSQPTNVQHVVFNGRIGKKGCDLTRGKPKLFAMGDTQSFPWNSDCGESFVRIDIYTDRGMVTYEMKDLK